MRSIRPPIDIPSCELRGSIPAHIDVRAISGRASPHARWRLRFPDPGQSETSVARNFVIFTELECHHAGPVGVVFLELRDLAVPEQSMAPWQMLIVSLRLAIDHIARIQQLSLKSSLVGVEVKTEKEASRRTCSVLDWGIGVVEHADDNGIF